MIYSPEEVPAISGIYALCCPETKEVKYIGQSKNIRARIQSHLRSIGHRNPKSEWLKDVLERGLSPMVKVLEKTDELNEAEKRHIKSAGVENLLNVHHGGEYEGRLDPMPWRVIGCAHPTKMLYLRCRNVGVSGEILSLMKDRVASCADDRERVALELRVANDLMDTPLGGKVVEWLKVAAPRIKAKFPEMFYYG